MTITQEIKKQIRKQQKQIPYQVLSPNFLQNFNKLKMK